ncbi:MAG TPA: hypothetical protein VMU55_01635, partial [Solirubrobacteraceae bacterium]|nr:hypothetical protein [Solirubrobacteraceae bacterium]
LAGIFDKFRQWLVNTYQAMTGSGIRVTAGVRQVMDRMLATDQEIKEGTPRAYAQPAADGTANAIYQRDVRPGVEAGKVGADPFADKLPQAPGEPSLSGHVNYNRITTPTDAKLALVRVAQEFEQKIEAQRRGTVSNQQTSDEAAKILNDTIAGRDGRLVMPRDPGTPAGAAELLARKALVEGSTVDMMRVGASYRAKGAQATAEDTLEYLASIERVGMITSEFLGARSEAGRALQILKATLSAAERGRQIQQVIALYGGEPMKLAEAMKDIDSPAGAVKFSKDVTSLTGAAEKLLDNLQTVLAANAGDPVELDRQLEALVQPKPGRPKSDQVKLGVAAVRDAVKKARGDPAALAALVAKLKTPEGAREFALEAMKPTIWDKLGEIWKAFLLSGPKTYMVKAIGDAVSLTSGITERGLAVVLGRLHGGERVTAGEAAVYVAAMIRGSRDALTEGVDALKNPDGPFEHVNAIGGAPGFALSIPHRVMGGETQFFRVLNERGELAALAMRQARNEGLEHGTTDFTSRVATLISDPTQEMSDAAKLAGDRGTFTEKLGSVGDLLANFSRHPIGQFIVPFSKVPANLVKWAVRRMPGVSLMIGDVRDDFAAGGARRDLAIARWMIGSAAASLAYGAVRSGVLTGGGLSMTPAERRSKYAAGWQPYALKLGERYYTYNRFDPVARIGGLAADMAEMQDRVETDDKASLPLLAAMMFGNALVSQTYLSGLDSLLRALDDPGREGARYFDSFVGSWVPAILAQPADAADPDKRRVDSWLDEVRSRLPSLLPGGRQSLLPRINPLTGEPEANPATITPVGVSDAATDPVLTEAARLGVNVSAAPKTLHVGARTGKLGQVQITPAQQNAFDTASGHIAHQLLTPLVSSPAWATLPDMMKRGYYQKVLEMSHHAAALEALPPAERMEYLTGIMQQMLGQLQAPSEELQNAP